MAFHVDLSPSRRLIGPFIAMVVVVSTAVVLAIHAMVGSRVTGAVGGISGHLDPYRRHLDLRPGRVPILTLAAVHEQARVAGRASVTRRGR